MTTEQRAMIDTHRVPDIFVSGLGSVENMGGGCYRFTLYSKQHVGEREVMVVVARFIMPMEAILPAIVKAGSAIGMSLAATDRPTLN